MTPARKIAEDAVVWKRRADMQPYEIEALVSEIERRIEEEINSIRFTGDIQRLDLKPNDVFVITIPNHIPEATSKRIQEVMQQEFPKHKAFILADGIKLSIVSDDTDVHTE